MPFYKRMDELRRVFPAKAQYLQRNGIEVVIVADEPSEQYELLDYIRGYPFINWKIIVNHNEHPWRNPSKALNVGIRMASKKYILIMSPESEFYSDVAYIFYKYLESYPEHFAVGQVLFTDFEQEVTESNIDRFNKIPYGSIMARKQHFELVGGYNENYALWGGDDDNLRRRMELAGVKKLFCPEAILIHRENDYLHQVALRDDKRKKIPPEFLCEMLLPQNIKVNDDNWGSDFDDVVFDWRSNPYAARQCREYLSTFIDYQIPDDTEYDRQYRLIALIPVYNEAERISECLRSVEKHCDGIILLDDNSSDSTYSLAQSDKLLLKAKKNRLSFDDRQNRNILLNLASFFRSEWLIFIDADELFDERFIDLHRVMDLPVDIVGVWIANLWDNIEQFRTNMEDTNPFSQNGLWCRWRLFRNKGRMQFVHDRKLHFSSVPYFNKTHVSETLLLHSGYLDKSKREQKYNFYTKEDKEPIFSYSYILSEDVELQPIKHITKEHFKVKSENFEQ